MKRILIIMATNAWLVTPLYAESGFITQSLRATQISEKKTGYPSSGPRKAYIVVPAGATGGPSGEPNQSQFVEKVRKSKKARH